MKSKIGSTAFWEVFMNRKKYTIYFWLVFTLFTWFTYKNVESSVVLKLIKIERRVAALNRLIWIPLN